MIRRICLTISALAFALLSLPAAADCPPGAPQNMTASDGTSCVGVDLQWDGRTNADYYEIWRGLSTNYDNSNLVGTSNDTSFTDNTALPGIIYSYWVTCYQIDLLCGVGPANHRSAPSARNVGSVGGTPNIPTGVTASASTVCGAVYITWNAVAGATTYDVWREDFVTNANTLLIGASVNTDWTDTLAVVGTQYSYWVRARNLCGTSGASSPDNGEPGGLPGMPTGVSASNSTLCGSVYITWNAVPNANSYQVFRDPGPVNIAIGSPVTNDWTDVTAISGQPYTYTVRSSNLCGDSALSPGVSGQPLGPPSAPTGVSASDGTVEVRVEVTWDSVPNATSYIVYVALRGDGFDQSSFLGFPLNNNWTHLTAAGCTNYTYWVKAVNLCQNSPESAPDDGYFVGSPIPAPTIVNATVSGPQFARYVDISWTGGVGTGGTFEIWRSPTLIRQDGMSIGHVAGAHFHSDFDASVCARYFYWVRQTDISSACSSDWSGPDSINHVTLEATQGSRCDGVFLHFYYGYVQPRSIYRDNILLYRIEDLEHDYLDTSAVPGQHYLYKVAYDNVEAGCNPASSFEVEGWSGGAAAPTGFSASDATACGAVDMSWNASTGATLYRIYRDGVILGTTTDLFWQDVPPVPGQVYTYAVSAERPPCSPSAQSQNTGSAGFIIQPPTDVSATDGTSCADVRITWTAAPGATSYEIFRNGGSIGTTGDATAFNDTTAVPGQVYAYDVRSSSICGVSGSSTPDDGHRPGPISITQHPQPQSVTQCAIASFSIATDGGGTPTYQWRRNGQPVFDGPSAGGGTVAGATTAMLTITAPGPFDRGSYTCVVTCGNTVTSNSAALTAVCRPDINCSGTVTVQDIFDFLALYFAYNPRSDYNQSGAPTVQDVFDFLAGYFAGCP